MANKNKKRGKRLIESARRRKRERFQTMTPRERRMYERERQRQRMENKPNEYNVELSFKENVLVALATIVSFAILCGITYLLYLGIHFIYGLAG